jgi:hypothetical protein
MKTLTGVFGDPETALHAGERAREAAGERATVRVFIRGAHGSVIETSIISDESTVWRVPIVGLTLGGLFAATLALFHVPAAYCALGFFGAAAVGLMFGLWLTGEIHPRRISSLRTDGQSAYERILAEGRAVVTVVLPNGRRRMKSVFGVLAGSGAEVVEGFLHEQPVERRPLGPTSPLPVA